MAEGDLIGEIVGGSSQNKAITDFMRSSEFQAILQGYSYLFTQTTGSSSSSTLPAGSIVTYATASAPSGWLLCDGSTYPQDLYPSLFSVITRDYGGDATARTFQVPDLRGRTIVGVGNGAGLTARSIRATGGEENHTLSTAEIPSHNHTLHDPGHTHENVSIIGGGGSGWGVNNLNGTNVAPLGFTYPNTTGIYIDAAGGGGGHNNMQPYIVLSYIIKAG